jgi:hypothetical protein
MGHRQVQPGGVRGVKALLAEYDRGVELLPTAPDGGVPPESFATGFDIAGVGAGTRGSLGVATDCRVKAAGPLVIAGGRQCCLGARAVDARTIAELQRQRRQRSGRSGR